MTGGEGASDVEALNEARGQIAPKVSASRCNYHSVQPLAAGLELFRIGIVRFEDDGALRWPIRIGPWWIWKARARMPRERFGLFRNLPHVIKWYPYSMLPRRWGFFVLGLEIGQRG